MDRVTDPVTVPELVSDLRGLGLTAGDTVLVHSSLSAIGWVSGGAPAVVDPLLEVLTDEGTLVAPTHTPQYGDPDEWSHPPVPDEWIERIRETRPPYRPEVTPTRGVGAIAECFRSYPGVIRSDHPVLSFAARGANAEAIARDHALDYGLGEGSPLARLYERDGSILFLGTDHATNTSLHLAEYRADYEKEIRTGSAPIREDGRRVEVEYEDVVGDTEDFAEVGAAFEHEVGLVTGTVGAATARLANQRELVDFAVDWFETHR